MIAKMDDRILMLLKPPTPWSQSMTARRQRFRSDERIIALYARGMTRREIQSHFHERYGVEVSPEQISDVTDAVLEEAREWQKRPLDGVYPIVYLDTISLKLGSSGQARSQAMQLALGIDFEGHKQLLGIWLGEPDGAGPWPKVLAELRERGLQDILIACVDGVTGIPEAREKVLPRTQVQLCLVQLIRHSLKYVSWKERTRLARDLRTVYAASNAEAAERALEAFAGKWDDRFPSISKLWRSRWKNLLPFFSYPDPIRKILYTTNAIESVHSSIRKVTAKRGAFPTVDSVHKVVYLAVQKTSERWKRPIKNWASALNHFAVAFDESLPSALNHFAVAFDESLPDG